MNPLYYLLGVLALFAVFLAVLEYVRRKSIEDIRSRSLVAFMNYYEMKINEFCKDKGEDCRAELTTLVAQELSNQVVQNRMAYIDIEKLYEKHTAGDTN